VQLAIAGFQLETPKEHSCLHFDTINTIESVARLLDMVSISEREESSSQASQHQGQEEDLCPICFIPLQRAFNERGGMSITRCCNTMLCNVCADNVQDELKKGTLKYSCIFGTLCTRNN